MTPLAIKKEDVLKIKKLLAFILRHKPFFYKVKLDSEGGADTDILLGLVEKYCSVTILREDLIQLAKNYSGGIFKVSKDGSKISARAGHSFTYNLTVPDGFVEVSELPNDLYFSISSSDFGATIKSNFIPLSNKQILLSKTTIAKENGVVICHINTKKINIKEIKFYYNEKLDRFFTRFVPKNSIVINV